MPSEPARDDVLDYYALGWDLGLEAALAIVRQYLSYYPENIFPAPLFGQHGKTVDSCSAAALRAVLPNIIADIQKLTGKGDKVSIDTVSALSAPAARDEKTDGYQGILAGGAGLPARKL